MSKVRAGLVALSDADDLLIGRWQELAAAAFDPNPFAHPDFALPAARTLPDGADAALLHVEDGAEMVLALPVVHRRRYRRVPLRTLATWRHPYCFLGSPLTSAADAAESWGRALHHLRQAGGLDLLALELLPAELPGLAAVEVAAAQQRIKVSTFDRHARPVIHRRAEPTYFDASMSSKHRKNLRRQRRHLDALLEGQLRRVDWGPQNLARPAAAELFLRLEQTGWKGRVGTAMACAPADEAFFRLMVERFGEKGLLQLWFLEASGTPVAAQCNLISGDTVFHFKIAYDEDLAQYSPGVLLELEMIQEFHEDARLNHIDSCAAPGSMYESLYPDSRALTGAVVPLRSQGRMMAPMLAAGLRRRSRIELARAGREEG
jgi:CelD/BcsL family acetyltransferase involved in cellulose biosynthesis